MTTRARSLTMWLLAGFAGVALPAQSPPGETAPPAPPSRVAYLIAVQDVLNVTVEGRQELTGTFTVLADGTITMPLIGRISAVGQTAADFEKALTVALADGLIRNPQVSVTLDHPQGRRIFIFGSVGAPGTYVLGDSESLIQALARAGYTTGSEAVIVRPRQPAGPTVPETADNAEVIRVNLKELEKDIEKGSLARNVMLREGDTIFVPRVDPNRVFITGEVRNPGAYPITEGTTVLQALALASGPTERAALNRIRIIRIEKGKQVTLKAKLTDILRPGDTLKVPERFME